MLTRLFQTMVKFREILILGAALWLVKLISINLVIPIAFALFWLGNFTLVTGWGLPRLKGRWKGLGILLVSTVMVTVVTNEQREDRWAVLRQTDPDTYLAELSKRSDSRWLRELEELRPEAYQAEIVRREREAEDAGHKTTQKVTQQETEETKVAQGAKTGVSELEDSVRTGLAEDDFYWDEDTSRYRAEIVKVVNRIAAENAKCPNPDPQSVMLSTSRSKPGAPVFFVTCGQGAGVFNLWFSPKDAASEREFRAVQPIARSAAAATCEQEARARAVHPSTVKFSRFVDMAYMTYDSGRARVTSKFTARNAFNLELTYVIDCLFEGDSLLEVNIYES